MTNDAKANPQRTFRHSDFANSPGTGPGSGGEGIIKVRRIVLRTLYGVFPLLGCNPGGVAIGKKHIAALGAMAVPLVRKVLVRPALGVVRLHLVHNEEDS